MMPLILLLPLLVAILAIILNKNHALTSYIALAGSVVSLLLLPFITGGTSSIDWFAVSNMQVGIVIEVTMLNYLLLCVVLVIGALVLLYSLNFMNLPSEGKRYYIEMLAFEIAMLTFAMAGNFILLFIAWEFLSLISYLLIGFWHGRSRATAAARKAITIVLIGDIALFASMVMVQNEFGTLQFSSIISNLGSESFPGAAAALLIIAILTKSAQFPFQEWLPDAMESPTPVSAFLHSSTMAKAGVFVAIVLFPLLSAAKALNVLLIIGIITVLLGMFSALRERHVKRVLAYSTIQELGLMLVAVASNALLAAIYFFFVQSFYKALLLLSSGITTKANDRENLDEQAGIKQNRIVYITTLFGVLALAGFIPFAGFFVNVGFAATFSTNVIVYAIISLVSLGTSLYAFRWLILQGKKKANPRVLLNYNSVPRSMSYTMVVLATLSLVASAAFFFLPNTLSSIGFIAAGGSLTLGVLDAIIETAFVVLGAFAGYYVYRKRKANTAKEIRLMFSPDLVYTAGAFNATYNHFAAFFEALADGFEYCEMKLSDLSDWFGHVTLKFGNAAGRLANGRVNAYLLVFAVGLLLLIFAAVVI